MIKDEKHQQDAANVMLGADGHQQMLVNDELDEKFANYNPELFPQLEQ